MRLGSESGPAAGPALQAILFDLDDTLFDHAHATRSALAALREVEPSVAAWSLDEFVDRHDVILEALHVRVLAAEITVDTARRERFRRLLEAAGTPEPVERSVELATIYRGAYEVAWRTVPGGRALLEAVRSAGLRTVVVTNNGVAEQRRKLVRCDLAPVVDALVTSEEVGFPKPAPEIFRVALEQAGARAAETVMLGDAWTADIEGARASGIRPVWLNRKGAVSPDATVQEVRSLEPADEVLRALLARPEVRT